ncbi:MAG: hypothetical protein EHM35_11365, partial [Planctomycetaceae bacterium]
RQRSTQLTAQDKANQDKAKAQQEKEAKRENKSWIPTSTPELSLSGNVSYNQIQDSTIAGIYGGVFSSVTDVDVQALNTSWIASYAGSASISNSYYDTSPDSKTTTTGKSTSPGKEAAPKNKPAISGAASASVTINAISQTTSAYVDKSNLSLLGDLTVLADTSLVIAGMATAGSISVSRNNSGFGVAGSGVVNMITSLTEAYVRDSIVDADGMISIRAYDNNLIVSGAGSLSVSVSTTDQKSGTGGAAKGTPKTQAAVSVSPAAAISIINSTARAHASDSTLIADNDIDINAVSNETVISLASGISGAGADSNKGSFALAGAGSASINVITAEVEAYIAESNPGAGRRVQISNRTVTVDAEDNSVIVSNAGALAISSAKGTQWGIGLALGAAVAVNISDKKVRAGISGADVEAGKDIIITAESNANTWALTMGGFGAGAKGTERYAFALSAGAAGSVNMMDSVVESYISEGSSIHTISGAVILSAQDNATIEADSLVVGIAVAVGKTSAVAASLGGSFSVNDLRKEVRSTISDSTVTSAQQVDIDASSNGTIWALTVGGVGSGGKAEQNFGGAISVAGAGSVNVIDSTVEAGIEGSTVTSGSGLDVSLAAVDSSTIAANAGILSIAVGLGSKALAASLGASVAINSVTGGIRAYAEDSTITSSGGLDMTAESKATIWAMTLAGVGAGGKG